LNPSTIGANQPIDIGSGTKIRAAFTIPAAVVGTVSTVQFQIITSAAALLTSPVVIGTSIAIPEARLTINAQFFVEMNQDVLDIMGGGLLRFLGCQYVIAVATTTLGTVTADFVIDVQDGHRFYNSGFAV
ncbi:MAG: hypothetical protein V3S43_01075, partial [Acidimicrobiia bacterium]